jgi:putative PIN family toxin of toxin-antitoxin system
VLSATFDSNVFVSALNYDGIPRRILNLAREGKIRLDISDGIYLETARVLYEKFKWIEADVNTLRDHLAGFANRVEPTERLTVVKDDPGDDKIVECAAAAGSDYLVTGDRHILKLGSHGKTQIVRPVEFLAVAQGRTR